MPRLVPGLPSRSTIACTSRVAVPEGVDRDPDVSRSEPLVQGVLGPGLVVGVGFPTKTVPMSDRRGTPTAPEEVWTPRPRTLRGRGRRGGRPQPSSESLVAPSLLHHTSLSSLRSGVRGKGCRKGPRSEWEREPLSSWWMSTSAGSRTVGCGGRTRGLDGHGVLTVVGDDRRSRSFAPKRRRAYGDVGLVRVPT